MLRKIIARDNLASRLLVVLAVYGILCASVVSILVFAGEKDPDKRAILSMGIGLIAIWCILGGVAMRLARNRFVEWSLRLRIEWRLRFVLFCIAMAMLEEAVTTSLTNAAPLFGAVSGAARITSSTNYFKVISGSVVVFIPWFICWAWILGRYDFRPLEVMLLFGLTGTMAESITFGYQHIAEIGMWVFVYGLMVYLPAHTVPRTRNAITVKWRHCIGAIFLPLVFIVPFAIFLIFSLLKHLASLVRKALAR